MSKEIKITPNGIKQALDDLLNENEELKHILEIQRDREYHSKFLKDFQKEKGKHVFPDHDEIYKRYDDYKSRNEEAIEYCELNKEFTPRLQDIIEILKGSDKE